MKFLTTFFTIIIFFFSVFANSKVSTFETEASKNSNNIYDIKFELKIGNEVVTKPRVIVREGQEALIEQKNDKETNFIEVVAKEGQLKGKRGILMNFKVGHVLENGLRRVVSTPQILARSGSESLIILNQNSESEKMILKVRAKKKNM